jgi:hypothetical protein
MTMNKWDDYSRIHSVLMRHQEKPFVKRILRTDNYSPVDMGDGTSATHLLSYGEADGKYYVFPSVFRMHNKSGKLDILPVDQAWEKAVQTKDLIPFDTEAEAAWFSRNYKRYWDVPGTQAVR